jgi:hypothetical protein
MEKMRISISKINSHKWDSQETFNDFYYIFSLRLTKRYYSMLGPASKEKSIEKVEWEFGGPVGSLLIMIWSHFLMLYLWMSLEYHKGGLFLPNLSTLLEQLQPCFPTKSTILTYWGFMLLQLGLAFVMPGPQTKGLPVPS